MIMADGCSFAMVRGHIGRSYRGLAAALLGSAVATLDRSYSRTFERSARYDVSPDSMQIISSKLTVRIGRLNDFPGFGHMVFTDARTLFVDFLAGELGIGPSIDP
jgi:hypothetical protein